MSLSEFKSSANPLYRFEPACEKRIMTLRDNKLWLRDPTSFNDPFDIRLNIDDQLDDMGFSETKYKAAAKILFKNYSPDISHWMFNKEIIEDINAWANGDGSILTNDIIKSVERHIAQFGVICFSQDWNIPLSWSHYAQSHKGFCIEYEVDDLKVFFLNNEPYSLQDVVYSNQLKNTCLSEIIFTPHKTLPRLLATKTTDWSYENERRLICFNQKNTAVDMPAGMRVKTIIAGCKADAALKEQLKEAAQHLNVGYSEIVVSKFEKAFERIEVF